MVATVCKPWQGSAPASHHPNMLTTLNGDEMKKCAKCGIEKEKSLFSKDRSAKDGLCKMCKECTKSYRKSYYEKNSDRLKKASSEWFWSNRERALKTRSDYHKSDPEKARVRRKAQYWKDPESARLASSAYLLSRQKTDPVYRFKLRCRKRVWAAFRENGYTKRSKTFDLVGCDSDSLIAHIESQFTEGMCWDNYGKWHLDHIIPFASANTIEDVETLCHYTNLQPLWAQDNLRKSARM